MDSSPCCVEATFEEYTRPQGPFNGIPTLAMIARSPQELLETAERLVRAMTVVIGHQADVGIEPGVGRVGGGALPLGDLPGPRVAVRPRHLSAGRVEQRLRMGHPAVLGLVKDDTLLIDTRTLLPDEPELLPSLLAAVLGAE